MILPLSTQYTVTATETALPSAPLQKQITFSAKSTNTGITYIGTSSGVSSSNGYPLEKGTSVTFKLGGNSNANIFFIVGTASDILGYAGT